MAIPIPVIEALVDKMVTAYERLLTIVEKLVDNALAP
jgi:hypothetical protein